MNHDTYSVRREKFFMVVIRLTFMQLCLGDGEIFFFLLVQQGQNLNERILAFFGATLLLGARDAPTPT